MKIKRLTRLISALLFSRDTRNKADQLMDWDKRDYTSPSAPFIKRALLLRLGRSDATWVETGTFEGETTKFLSPHARKIYSIEPEPELYAAAKKKLASCSNVEVFNGLSEEVFESLLPDLDGNLCFWLDGHFSGGVTHRGPQDTPILDESGAIEPHLSRWSDTRIFIDDIRCFNPKAYPGYPRLDVIVDWARSNNLHWHVEHDIFCAWKAA